jgi:hypothetical protein
MPKPRMLTPRLYRVFPWVPGVRARAPGHPLFSWPVQGAGRIDNPESYRTLYASDSPAGAIAEAFGNHATWTHQLLQGRRDLSGSVRAIAELDAEKADVLDFDDPRELVRRRLRPSTVVTRDRTVTQRLALDIFKEKRWAGARRWSRYDSRWGAFGLWALAEVRTLKVTHLIADHPALIEAAAILSRPWNEVP